MIKGWHNTGVKYFWVKITKTCDIGKPDYMSTLVPEASISGRDK